MEIQQSGRSSIGRRGVPGSVRAASGLMVAGGVTQMLRGALILAEYASAKGGDDPKSVTQAVVFLGLITTCGYTALWIWMAVKCRAGRGWARVTATVFFAFQVIGMFVPTGPSVATNALTHVLGFVVFGIGLVTVILLWTGDSRRYF